MVEENAIIVDQSPQAADPRLEKTTNPRSQTQKCDIREIKEDNRQTHKIYHFQNCGTVNLNVDSFNARTFTMENCDNNVPVTICSSFFFPLNLCPHVMSYYQSTELVAMRRAIKINICNPMPSLLTVCGCLPSPTKHVEHIVLGPRTSTDHPPQKGVDYVMQLMLVSASLLIISCLMVFIVNLPHLCDVEGMYVGRLL